MTGLEAVADAEDAVRRIAMLEARNPDIMIWPPDDSVSGDWEALGDGWLIQEKSRPPTYLRASSSAVTRRPAAHRGPQAGPAWSAHRP